MRTRVEFFEPDKKPIPFEGVAFSGRMADNKPGAYCKTEKFCLVAGAHNQRDVVALGRWNGEVYSALNGVPSPFYIRPSSSTAKKSSVVARNIVNRLCPSMEGRKEKELIREYLVEQERLGIAYELG